MDKKISSGHGYGADNLIIAIYRNFRHPIMKFISVYLNGTSVEMLFNAGASHLALTYETMKRIGINEILGGTRLYAVYGVIESKLFNISSVRPGNCEFKDVFGVVFPPPNKLSDVNILVPTLLIDFNW